MKSSLCVNDVGILKRGGNRNAILSIWKIGPKILYQRRFHPCSELCLCLNLIELSERTPALDLLHNCAVFLSRLEGVMSTSFSPPAPLSCFDTKPHLHDINSRICLFCLLDKGLLKENITFSYHFLQPVLAGTLNSRQTDSQGFCYRMPLVKEMPVGNAELGSREEEGEQS